ncbi:DUF350 domain-containing protein [Flammeovirgaceae bacterium SG7u.111]|nr:DUF350 domain-containing protein [Flammeovirgaceae bacterium SG7u.132]WPO36727.1 DUF350 domain-containing protein [Flammeovirgaceae bacterium SG7u.111]
MDTNLVLFSSYETMLSLVFGLLTVYLSIKIINQLIMKVDFFSMVKQGNIAVSVFEGTLIFCTLLLVENSIMPAVDALRTMVLATGEVTPRMMFISFSYFISFYFISLIFCFLLLIITFYVFIKATTSVDEIAEIKKNNISVAIMLSIVIISVTLFIRPAFHNFIGSLVSYDTLEQHQFENMD